jgi:hypothetical protein
MGKKWHPVKLSEVDDVVAEDVWKYNWEGRKVSSRVAIGLPTPDPSGQDWYTPVFIEHRTKGWRPAYGVGPVDSMMNAMTFVSRFFHETGPSPKGGSGRPDPRAARRRKPRSRRWPDATSPRGGAIASTTSPPLMRPNWADRCHERQQLRELGIPPSASRRLLSTMSQVRVLVGELPKRLILRCFRRPPESRPSGRSSQRAHESQRRPRGRWRDESSCVHPQHRRACDNARHGPPVETRASAGWPP